MLGAPRAPCGVTLPKAGRREVTVRAAQHHAWGGQPCGELLLGSRPRDRPPRLLRTERRRSADEEELRHTGEARGRPSPEGPSHCGGSDKTLAPQIGGSRVWSRLVCRALRSLGTLSNGSSVCLLTEPEGALDIPVLWFGVVCLTQ